jgi:aspartate beta-hydroxylase
MSTTSQNPDTARREQEIHRALQSGQRDAALSHCGLLLQHIPDNRIALLVSAQLHMQAREYSQARAFYEKLASVEPDPMHWVNAALACEHVQDEAGEADSIQQALTLDPVHLIALICRARMLERQGKRHKAAAAYGAVAAVAPPIDQLSPDLRAAVNHGLRYSADYSREFGGFLDDALKGSVSDLSRKGRERFSLALDIMSGRKRRYDSQSLVFHYPGLVPVEFFERERFSWLDAFEENTDQIREEFLQVLQREDGFTPYITYPKWTPVNQFAELNNSPNWSAYHLIKGGQVVEGNATNCPQTMELLKTVPQPDQPGRTPVAMFSLLKPRTRIPPHVGASNVRLVTHVPLIIPERCGFRVGNTTREWVPGKAWVFDDTINHEAWNLSDKLRVVLIFDTWHPDLDESERKLICELTEGINRFTGEFLAYDA